jgi:hypothetical protein
MEERGGRATKTEVCYIHQPVVIWIHDAFFLKRMIAYFRVRARKTGNIERGLLRDFFGPQRRLNIAIVRSSFGNELQRLTICRGEVDT